MKLILWIKNCNSNSWSVSILVRFLVYSGEWSGTNTQTQMHKYEKHKKGNTHSVRFLVCSRWWVQRQQRLWASGFRPWLDRVLPVGQSAGSGHSPPEKTSWRRRRRWRPCRWWWRWLRAELLTEDFADGGDYLSDAGNVDDLDVDGKKVWHFSEMAPKVLNITMILHL